MTGNVLGLDPPYSIVAGDLGEGTGSRKLYRFAAEELKTLHPKVITIHYILPIKILMDKFVKSLENWENRPILIADAGGMYVAKSSGNASAFDLFTPDPGEMAFLADPEAEHPAYVRHFISEVDLEAVPKLIKAAYRYHNASKVIIVKGATDFIAKDGEIVTTISEPLIPALEPIGGTGDTITGIASAFVYGGYDLVEASILAARVNRIAGLLSKPTPATRISEFIQHIPEAVKRVLAEEAKEGLQ